MLTVDLDKECGLRVASMAESEGTVVDISYLKDAIASAQFRGSPGVGQWRTQAPTSSGFLPIFTSRTWADVIYGGEGGVEAGRIVAGVLLRFLDLLFPFLCLRHRRRGSRLTHYSEVSHTISSPYKVCSLRRIRSAEELGAAAST